MIWNGFAVGRACCFFLSNLGPVCDFRRLAGWVGCVLQGLGTVGGGCSVGRHFFFGYFGVDVEGVCERACSRCIFLCGFVSDWGMVCSRLWIVDCIFGLFSDI
jgi:hypothetical protein